MPLPWDRLFDDRALGIALERLRGFCLMPPAWIMPSPNGAGKTPFALEYLHQVARCSRL